MEVSLKYVFWISQQNQNVFKDKKKYRFCLTLGGIYAVNNYFDDFTAIIMSFLLKIQAIVSRKITPSLKFCSQQYFVKALFIELILPRRTSQRH